MKAILYQHSIRPYTTFNIAARSAEFVSVQSIAELKEALEGIPPQKIRLLGGGSNMLWTKDFEGRTIHLNLKGITTIETTENEVLVDVEAGENWHDFVLWTLKNDLGGVENLALIPGNVGTAPIQNIGAYGVELKDVMESCTLLHRNNLKEDSLSTAACRLGYRDSIFKNKLKDQVVITSVRFRLSKAPHSLHTSYGALAQELATRDQTIQEVAQAVIRIRQRKLPDPKEIGNCGSFFKNPIVSQSVFLALQEKYPNLPSYAADSGVKIPAAWLIDQLGFKGIRRGDAGVHPNQALVLVNYANASGAEIWALAQEIQEAVKTTFGIALEAEVTRY